MATTLPPPYYFDPTIYHYEQQPTYYDASAFYSQHQYQQQQQMQHHQQQNQMQHHHPIPPHPPPADYPPSEEEPDPILALNLRVLRRHLPQTSHILYQAQYAVIYTFSPQSTGWEKSGKEGTLFIVQEQPGGAGAEVGGQGSNGAALVVLNRRGMDNFVMRDWDPQVQSEGGHIILRGRVEGEAVTGGGGGENGGAGEGEDLTVWGVWIWEEEDLESTRGKREGVEACLIACAGGGEAVEEREEEEQVEKDGTRESETTMDPDGDGAVFEERTQQLGGQALDRMQQQQQQQQQQQHQQQQSQQQQQQHQKWGYRHPEQLPQHFQHPHHVAPPPPSFQQQTYSQLQAPHQPPDQTPYHPAVVPPGPASPNLMALLNGGSASQQATFPPANTQSGSTNANGGRDILGDLFRNAGR